MQLLSERYQMQGVAERWKAQYEYSYEKYRDRRIKGDKLSALDVETATAKDVYDIIGVAWVCEVACNECGEKSWNVVSLGEDPDYDSATADICIDCLRKAVEIVDKCP